MIGIFWKQTYQFKKPERIWNATSHLPMDCFMGDMFRRSIAIHISKLILLLMQPTQWLTVSGNFAAYVHWR